MKFLRRVWAAAQGNPRNPKIAKRFKRSMNQEAKRPLIPLTPLKAAAKRRWGSQAGFRAAALTSPHSLKAQFQSRMRSILQLKRVCAGKHGFQRT